MIRAGLRIAAIILAATIGLWIMRAFDRTTHLDPKEEVESHGEVGSAMGKIRRALVEQVSKDTSVTVDQVITQNGWTFVGYPSRCPLLVNPNVKAWTSIDEGKRVLVVDLGPYILRGRPGVKSMIGVDNHGMALAIPVSDLNSVWTEFRVEWKSSG